MNIDELQYLSKEEYEDCPNLSKEEYEDCPNGELLQYLSKEGCKDCPFYDDCKSIFNYDGYSSCWYDHSDEWLEDMFGLNYTYSKD